MPADPQGRPPGDRAGAGAERQLLEAQIQAGAPPVFMFTGAVYVVLSGMVFLSLSGTRAAGLWAATAALGVLLVAAGAGMRRVAWPGRTMGLLASGLAVLVILHSLLVLYVSDDPGQTSYMLMLLIGAGYLLLSPPGLLLVDAVALGGWILVAGRLDVSPWGEEGRWVLAGLVLGAVAHVLRRRNSLRLLRARQSLAGTLEASEERFRSLAETAQDTILLLDGDGRLTYVNPAGMALFGLRPGDLGRPAGHLLGAAGNEPEKLVGTTELVGQRKDGSKFPAELSLARTVRPEGVVYTGVLRDITERKRAAAATQAAAAQDAELENLRKMNSFKTHFLNTAAHELNTPLTPLRLQLHLLKSESMGPLNEKQAKAMALLDRNVTRLSGLVSEILEVARLQSGRVRLTPAVVEVDAVVDEVIESFNETARRVGVGLAFEGTPGLSAYADRNRFTQVLFNLVSNALKFTPAGGSVTISAVAKGGQVLLEVRDTGLGLTGEQMGRLFQPFSQVHDPMAITAAGTGLGLYICKGLVEAQGGRIEVRSAGPGRGSAFSFTLPAGPAGAATGQPTPTPEAVPPAVVQEDAMVRRLRELI